MAKTFRPYDVNQRLLLPPSLRDWVPEGHLAYFVLDLVKELDLTSIRASYEKGDGRGRPPYHPELMIALLVYGYCTGTRSSRRIEKATYENIAYRLIAADQHPDHDSIAEFRKRHLESLAGLFAQVLRLCMEAGLVKLGHIALDGTKIRANASKRKAMSYERMLEAEKKLDEEVRKLLEEAERIDAEEDESFGSDRRGDELPAELAKRETRIKKLGEARAALEQEAKERVEQEAEQARKRIAEREQQARETGKGVRGKTPKVPDPDEAKPLPTAQRNFTDPESRIMKDGTTKSFEQSYNAQACVDSQAQIIIAAGVTQEVNDRKQLVPMLIKAQENLGEMPPKVSADAGYFSSENLSSAEIQDVDLYIPPDRQKHGSQSQEVPPPEDLPPDASSADRMKLKLKTPEGRDIYKLRKQVVEPVFGQIKEILQFRRFSFRGLTKTTAEWAFVCLIHNLLKLFRNRTATPASG